MDIGIGAKLKLEDTQGSDTFTAVSPLLALTPPGPEVTTWEYVEVDGARVRKSIASVKDPGDWSFECEYTKEIWVRLEAVQGLIRDYRITYVDTGELEGPAILKKLESVPGETGQVIVCNLRCSDEWTFDDPED